MVMLVSWRIDRLLSLVAVLAMVGVAGLAPPAHAQRQEPAKRTQSTKPAAKPKPPTAKQAAAAKLDAAAPSDIGPTTVARYAYMIDMQTGTVLLAKDANKPMAPSSMAKMMTTYLLFEDLAAGKLKPETQFKVSERAYAITRGVHSSTMFLELGAEVSVLDLIQGIIVDSGNDASVAVAEGMAGSEEAFADRMNKKAH